MPSANSLATTSLALSTAIGMVALLLGLHQWSQSRGRDDDLVDLDRIYFLRQDWRRAAGVLALLLIAAGIYVGSRVSPLITEGPEDLEVRQALRIVAGPWVEQSIRGHANPLFLTIWLGVIVMLVALLGLAFFDWVATRRYALRQRQSMARERLDILRETFRRTDTERNGHAT